MFTQRLSMDCTQEQYEKYLKAELEKMGYREDSCSQWHQRENEYITNCYIGLGNVGNINKADIYNIVNDKLTYLGKFNAPLFLALASMTDKGFGGIGEYWMFIGKQSDTYSEFVNRKLYKSVKFNEQYPLFKDELGSVNGYSHSGFFQFFRKATVSEIMAKFGEQPQKDIYITLAFEKEPIWENCEKLIDEYEAIHLLKSKGYRIFKQTTTLEEV